MHSNSCVIRDMLADICQLVGCSAQLGYMNTDVAAEYLLLRIGGMNVKQIAEVNSAQQQSIHVFNRSTKLVAVTNKFIHSLS